MYFDWSLKLQGAGAWILFIASKGEQLKYGLQVLFLVSNNTTEYEVMMHGLHVNISLGIKQLIVYGDSLIAISQANKDWDYSIEVMSKYYATVCQIEDKFEGL